MRVLVVEDDPDARLLLADEIGRDGRALVAASAVDALSMLSDLPELTAVVTDSHLGDGPGGLEVLRAVRARHPRCIRVLVTASPDVFGSDCDTSLVDTIFHKPWAHGEIQRYLRVRLAQ